jgi:hypothetical protein
VRNESAGNPASEKKDESFQLGKNSTGTARAEELPPLFRPFSLYTQSRQSI